VFVGELFVVGERIRTPDVQLGKQIPAFTEKLGKPVFPVS
jgi:hypothetical protein